MRVSLCFVLASACVLARGHLSAQVTQRTIRPVEAVVAAAEAAARQQSVRGVFELHVRTTGWQDSLLYLNSELDYRDQRSLTVAITPAAEQALRDRFGEDPVSALKGKKIQVSGAAQRVTIWFFCDGKRTEKYYYQTHVPVFRADQITVIPDNGSSK